MNEKIISNFTILISAPSDVANYMQAVRESIAEYNTETGHDRGIFFQAKDWKHDTLPGYGKAAQKIINEQIVIPTDAVIALFGTKFGTPTEEYDSGTLEEIEIFSNEGKEVIVFFGEGRIAKVHEIDPEQLKKVNEFKRTFNGLYATFSSKSNLKKLIKDKLVFLGDKLKKKTEKDLKLYTYNYTELLKTISYQEYDFINSNKIKELETQIIKNIDIVNNIHLKSPIKVMENSESGNEISEIIKKMQIAANAFFPKTDIKLDDELDELVKKFSLEHRVSLSSDYAEIGNACYRVMHIADIGGKATLEGTEDEKKKVRALKELPNLIREYYGLLDFLGQFDKIKTVSFVLKNESNIFADDISVKITFPSNCYFDISKVKINSLHVADDVKDFLLFMFDNEENVDIESMERGLITYPFETPNIPQYINKPKLKYYNEYLQTTVKELYPCIINFREDKIIMKFDIKKGIKQFTTQFLCGKMLFKSIPSIIDYSITSKSFGHEIKGAIKLMEK